VALRHGSIIARHQRISFETVGHRRRSAQSQTRLLVITRSLQAHQSSGELRLCACRRNGFAAKAAIEAPWIKEAMIKSGIGSNSGAIGGRDGQGRSAPVEG